jgi:oligopeptide transport system substrate-binding protein
MINRALPVLALLAATAAGCDRKPAGGPIVVSVIGPSTELADPGRDRPARPDAALLGAVAQGLVRFDATGQITAGLAIRWAVSDDGLYYTFRLDRDGPPAEKIAQLLRRRIALASGGALRPILDGVDEVVAVTPEVIEVRLGAPRPDLLTVFARPELGLLVDAKGSGPLRITRNAHGMVVLETPPDPGAGEAPRHIVELRGERVGLATARFAKGASRLVLGGTYADFAYVPLAGLAPQALQIDPTRGLFGLMIRRPVGLLAAPEGRQALSMVLDRDAIGAILAIPGWRSTQAILPDGVSDVPAPTRPLWGRGLANVRGGAGQGLAGRIAEAQLYVAGWTAAHGRTAPMIKLYLPEGPGSRLLFAAVERQWRSIGVRTIRVDRAALADLVLIDEVAPSDQADWFLAHFRCGTGAPCSEQADLLFGAARTTLDGAERGRLLAQAEQRLADITPFLPIGQPVRWSLVAPGLEGFATNPRAAHPLAALVGQ